MEYLIKMNVIAYSFDVDCKGVDNCKMKDDFLGYPDPRPLRPFANIRYALYEQWLSFYPDNAYILILDFRDTIFQRNPFEPLGAIDSRPAIYDLRVYAENEKVLIYAFAFLYFAITTIYFSFIPFCYLFC